MIALLLALVVWMLGQHGPTPTPHGVTASPVASAPATVAPARAGQTARVPHSSAALASPTAPAAATVAPPPLVECPAHPQMSDDPAYAACPGDPGEVAP